MTKEIKIPFCKDCSRFERMKIRVQDGYEWSQYGMCRKDTTPMYAVITPCNGYCDDFREEK